MSAIFSYERNFFLFHLLLVFAINISVYIFDLPAYSMIVIVPYTKCFPPFFDFFVEETWIRFSFIKFFFFLRDFILKKR